MNERTKKIVLGGLLTALAIVLSYVELLLPVFFAVPGIKLGLTNLVVVFALYAYGEKYALGINIIRIIIVGFLFGNGLSIVYSLAGGVFSFLGMLLAKNIIKCRLVTVSACGGVTHNLGQLLAAMILMKTYHVAWYLVPLWISGILAGAGIGVLCGLITGRLQYKRFL